MYADPMPRHSNCKNESPPSPRSDRSPNEHKSDPEPAEEDAGRREPYFRRDLPRKCYFGGPERGGDTDPNYLVDYNEDDRYSEVGQGEREPRTGRAKFDPPDASEPEWDNRGSSSTRPKPSARPRGHVGLAAQSPIRHRAEWWRAGRSASM